MSEQPGIPVNDDAHEPRRFDWSRENLTPEQEAAFEALAKMPMTPEKEMILRAIAAGEWPARV